MSSSVIYVVERIRSHSFSELNNIPLYTCTIYFLILSSLIYTYGVSILWLLWIILQWTWMCRFLHDVVLSLILPICSEEGLHSHIVILFLIFLKTICIVLHNGYTNLTIPTDIFSNNVQVFPPIHTLANICLIFDFW
jgi:hypothetical protein